MELASEGRESENFVHVRYGFMLFKLPLPTQTCIEMPELHIALSLSSVYDSSLSSLIPFIASEGNMFRVVLNLQCHKNLLKDIKDFR